jgi:predicted CoA-binding protein
MEETNGDLTMPTISGKSVAQRLFIKADKRFLLVNPPEGYEKVLGELPAATKLLNDKTDTADIIQVFVRTRAELEKELPRLKTKLNAGGALWVTYYKGSSKTKTDINRDSIAEYGSTIGLEGVAIISVDDDWSALRMKKL